MKEGSVITSETQGHAGHHVDCNTPLLRDLPVPTVNELGLRVRVTTRRLAA